MKNTFPNYRCNRRIRKNYNKKYNMVTFVLLIICLNFSINVVCGVTKFVSNNIKCYEVTKCIESAVVMNANMQEDFVGNDFNGYY